MNIEDIFEDLEARFAAALQNRPRDVYIENISALEVSTVNQIKKDLIAPILGKEFIAGLDSFAPVWHVYPTRALQQIIFHSEADESLPKLRNLGINLEAFLESLPKPCSIRWRINSTENFLHTGQLHSVTRNLLFIYPPDSLRPIAVSIAAIDQLSIESVDNLNGDF